MLPDTDAISPLTCAWPLAGADVVVFGVPVGLAEELGDDVGLDWFDEPHAAMDSAAAPVTARTANRASRGMWELADINVSPFVSCAQRTGLPAEPVRDLCVVARQNAASETRMMSSSMDSMTLRCAISFGSMFLAKNAAVAILPW